LRKDVLLIRSKDKICAGFADACTTEEKAAFALELCKEVEPQTFFFQQARHEKAPVENLEEEKQRESGVPTNR
jgi:hypothetical protein